MYVKNRLVTATTMSVIRTDLVSLFKTYKNLKGDVLPLVVEVLSYYNFLGKSFFKTNTKLQNSYLILKMSETTLCDVTGVWTKASLPIVSLIKVKTKHIQLLQKFPLVVKRARKLFKNGLFDETWLLQLFDISKCKCDI